jgi:toxin YhaV
MSKAFAEVHDALENEVAQLQAADPVGWRGHSKAKVFAAVQHLIYEVIPASPDAAIFLQGNTLGPEQRHWRRAKFMRRFRLFFRFDSATRVIVYGWLNDENTLRKGGARSDPYAVFLRRLNRGDPPDDWAGLLADADKSVKKTHS